MKNAEISDLTDFMTHAYYHAHQTRIEAVGAGTVENIR